MARSIILACNLSGLSDFTFIRQQNDVDGSFLVGCILGQSVPTPNAASILVCLHHTYAHYADAGKRLGFNLNNARNKGQLAIIDAIKDMTTELFNSNLSILRPEHLVNQLIENVENKVQTMLDEYSSVNLIFDDLSALNYLKINENMILGMCRRLKKLSGMLAPNLRVVVKCHNSNLYETLANNISDLATLEIEVKQLPSGHSKEVDGKLVIKKNRGTEEKTVLYKVNDRNIIVMQPGEPGLNV